MMVPGHEIWHPDPDFYYQPGGGPMLDMGPYYLTCLVNLLGPVRAGHGVGQGGLRPPHHRFGAARRDRFRRRRPTHISGILEFGSGASVTITTSFDVWKHGTTISSFTAARAR